MILEKILKLGILLSVLSLSSCCQREIYFSESVSNRNYKIKEPAPEYPVMEYDVNKRIHK